MPFRGYGETSVKVQFATSLRAPSLLRRAAEKTGCLSSTEYLQRIMVEALSRDLDLPIEELVAELPRGRRDLTTLFGDGQKARANPMRPGQGNTVERLG